MDLARLASGVLARDASAPAPVAFAAAELRRHLERLFGVAPREEPVARPGGAWLALGPSAVAAQAAAAPPPGGAEWAIASRGEALLLAGATPRALLAAVYALLEGAGCRWSPRGAADETLPAVPVRQVEERVARPAFRRRAYAADLQTWHYSMPDRLAERLPADVAFVDWMAKTGATGFHFIRHANDTQWDVPALSAELRRRGLDVELGGHALVELLPRALFATRPEWFPVDATGRRSDLGNVCASNPAARAVVGAAAQAMHAGADLHLWGLDLFRGGWCACPACRPLAPSDQSLTLANAVAEALDPGARVFHLAYHDTIEAPRTVAPGARVWAEFAPRERCYGHALDDPSCEKNPPYRAALEEHVERFDGRVEAFEYYGDAILFGGCAVPLVEVCARDLEFYRRTGVQGVACLTFGTYSLWAHGVTIEAFARGAVSPRAAGAARADCSARRYGAGADAMARYLATLERAMAGVVTWGDVKLPPPNAEAERALAECVARTPAMRRLLDEGRVAGAPAAAVEAEACLLDYTVATVAALRDCVAARRAGRAPADALAAVADALRHVAAAGVAVTGTFGAYDLELANAFFAAALGAS